MAQETGAYPFGGNTGAVISSLRGKKGIKFKGKAGMMLASPHLHPHHHHHLQKSSEKEASEEGLVGLSLV